MPLTRRQILAFKLSHRYKVKRSVFTLAIPVVIGVTIFVYALYSGFAPIPFSGGTSLNNAPSASGSSANQVQARQAAYAALVKQLNNFTTTTNSTSTSATSSAPSAHPNIHNFDLVLVGSAIIGLAPYSADVTLYGRKTRKYEEDFTDFLFELSELVRGGIDPIKAIATLAEGSIGAITQPVRMVSKQMQIGYTFEQAMRNLSITLNSSLIEKYIDLVIQASYSGGSVANLIQRASADMNTFLSIEKEKRAGLSQYTLILYTAQVVLIALSAILVIQFVPDLASIASLGSTSFSSSILGSSDIGSVSVERDLYFLVEINGFLGGLVIGKISEGKVKHGIKHGLILMLIGFLAWTLFVVPASSGTTATYGVTVVSYDNTGQTGFPLTDPIVVRVVDSQGNPGSSILVSFSISGPNGGGGAKLDPASASTDSNGTASAQVYLGEYAGVYTVTATVGGNSTAVNITAVGNGIGGA